MRDRPVIIAGLLFFLGLVSLPVWYNVAAGTTARGPEPERPAREKTCVAPAAIMRTSHMALLTGWRDEVVRQHARAFVAFDGTTYTKNVTGTCLKCHTSKADFCDRCHAYAGVAPYCWDCHVDPKLAQRGGA